VRRSLIAFALVVAACGGSAAPTPDPAGGVAAATTTPPVATTESTQDLNVTAPPGTNADSETPTAPTVAPRQRPEGRDAPDFTLALGQGGEFSLSAEQKPVYMVFWAEW